MFTIFTPTHNRAQAIEKLYNSLIGQTYNNFEWIIIDDGSTDNTREVIRSFIESNVINVKYYYQNNQGKQRAYNKAVKIAKGELFICIDDDDYYVSDGLEIILNEWKKIDNISSYAGLGYLSADKDGNIIGSKFPKDIFISNHIDIYSKYKVRGDKGLIYRTVILKKYPFPVINGEKFITEAVVYNRIAQKYKFKYFNKVIEIKEYKKDGLSENIQKIKKKYPLGYVLYYKEYLQYKVRFIDKLKAAVWYIIFCRYTGKKNIIKESRHSLLIIIAMPIAFLYKKIKNIKM